MQSLEFAYYHADLVDADTAVIALSSSGETTRTVEALLVAQHADRIPLPSPIPTGRHCSRRPTPH